MVETAGEGIEADGALLLSAATFASITQKNWNEGCLYH